LSGLKSGVFARFSPLFIYIVNAMRMKKRAKRTKDPSFQPPSKNPEDTLLQHVELQPAGFSRLAQAFSRAIQVTMMPSSQRARRQ
jgi:hypothetical protein